SFRAVQPHLRRRNEVAPGVQEQREGGVEAGGVRTFGARETLEARAVEAHAIDVAPDATVLGAREADPSARRVAAVYEARIPLAAPRPCTATGPPSGACRRRRRRCRAAPPGSGRPPWGSARSRAAGGWGCRRRWDRSARASRGAAGRRAAASPGSTSSP